MKITREWLNANTPCADGGSWGAFEVGAEGLDLSECWPRFDRADWLLWMIWKTGVGTLDQLREFVSDHLSLRLVQKPKRLSAEIFDEASEANLLGKDTLARELMAWGYLTRAYERSVDEDRVLHSLQAAVVQYTLSFSTNSGAHDLFCRNLKARFGIKTEATV